MVAIVTVSRVSRRPMVVGERSVLSCSGTGATRTVRLVVSTRPRESRARRRTNTEIAQELYVSVKTIETHLSRAYAKLDLSGQGARAQLTKVLGS